MRWKFKGASNEELNVELVQINGTEYRFKVGPEDVTLKEPQVFPFSIETSELHLSLESWSPTRWRAVNGEKTFTLEPQSLSATAGSQTGEIRTQMPGRVLKVLVEKGQTVKAKQTLLILEAMKMENEIRAEADAVVASIEVSPGQSLESGALLVRME